MDAKYEKLNENTAMNTKINHLTENTQNDLIY